ncbi:MAG: OmpA family protein [Blautia sp.]|nr:OmpA family protein [Blautia sp.]
MRKNRQSQDNGFNVWRSYSDMMAGVLLLFVLIMCVTLFQAQKSYEEAQANYQAIIKERDERIEMQEKFTAELLAQQTELQEQADTIKDQDEQLSEQNKLLAERAAELRELQEQLNAQLATLNQQESTLKKQKAELRTAKNELDEKTNLLALQQIKIDNIIGVKAEVIESLQKEFQARSVAVNIDRTSGSLTLDANVMFGYNESELTEEGMDALYEVLPIYCQVLLSEEFRPYLAEIIIDGYTDPSGDYAYNLELSQQRSLAVAQYLLDIQYDFLSSQESLDLESYLTVNGHSSANPIYFEDGSINDDASRRVEVKFRLKDDEMIQELSEILAEE